MHAMLTRQLQQAFSVGAPAEAVALLASLRELAARTDLDGKQLQALHGLPKLLDMVAESYRQFERAQELRLRSLTVSSAELMQANTRLHDDAGRQRALIDSIRTMANRMLAADARDPIAADEHSAEHLTQLMSELFNQSALAHHRMRESESRYRALTGISSDWYWEQDPQHRFTLMSSGVSAVSGQSPDDFIGQTAREAYLGREQDAAWIEHQRHLDAREPFRDFELRYMLSTRDAAYISISGEPGTDADGRFTGYRGIARNITARKNAEIHLQEALALTDALLESMPIPVLVRDSNRRITYINAAYEKLFEVDRKDLLMRESRHNQQSVLQEIARIELDLLANPGTRQFNYTLPTASGRDVHCIITKSTLPVRGGGIVTTYTDISGLKRTEENLTQAKQAAEQAMRVRSQFLANMSHEIRTPMNGVLGMAHLLAATALNAEQQEYVQAIRNSGDSLLRIVSDILDFSKIDAGKVAIEEIEFDLRSRVASILQLFAASAREKNISLSSAYAEDVPLRVTGDPVRITQTLSNLVGNAIKFTASGSVSVSIRVDTGTDEGLMLRFDVRDTGTGIAKDAIERIFDPFAQEDASTTRRFGGTGLGLTISRQLVELMGGELFVDSTPGAGSCFSFTVNLRHATGEARAAPPLLAIAPVASGHRAAHRLDILLAEDNNINQIVANAMLRKLGCSVTVANDGQEAVAQVKQHHYDLILMDCHMPNLDGFAATAVIRELEKLGHPRHIIIAQTANAMAGDRETCRAAGMDDYLTKPLSAGALAQMLERWGGYVKREV